MKTFEGEISGGVAMTCVKLVKAILVCITVSESKLYFVAFLAALAALYMTLVSE